MNHVTEKVFYFILFYISIFHSAKGQVFKVTLSQVVVFPDEPPQELQHGNQLIEIKLN